MPPSASLRKRTASPARSPSPAKPKPPAPAKSPSKKAGKGLKTPTWAKSAWAKYQKLLKKKPFTMNVIQTGALAMAGNVTAQLTVTSGPFSITPVIEQGVLGVTFIAPIVYLWFSFLGKMKMHWTKVTLIDQFVFSPILNVAIFLYISAFFKGGLSILSSSDALSLKLTYGLFPPLLTFNPVHSTQAKAYLLWLPATIVRELYVPPPLAPVFVNLCAFVWNIVFSIILAGA